MRIRVTVPTSPDYYNATTEVSAEDAQALAESIARQLREELPKRYPGAEISVSLVEEHTTWVTGWDIDAGSSEATQNLVGEIDKMFRRAWDKAHREVW